DNLTSYCQYISREPTGRCFTKRLLSAHRRKICPRSRWTPRPRNQTLWPNPATLTTGLQDAMGALPLAPSLNQSRLPFMGSLPDDSRDEEFRSKLSPEQYAVTRKGGTERAFTGAYYDEKRPGVYRCICCDAELFS